MRPARLVIALLAVSVAIAAGAVVLITTATGASASTVDLVVEGSLPADGAAAGGTSFQTVELWLFSVRTPDEAANYADQQMTLAATAPIKLGTYSLAVDLSTLPSGYVDADGAVKGRLDVVGGSDAYVGTVNALVSTDVAKHDVDEPMYVDADVLRIPVASAKQRTSCGTRICSGPYNACRQGDEAPIWHDIRQYTVERMVDFQRVLTLGGTRQEVRMYNGHQVSTSVMASVPWADAIVFSAGQQNVDEGSWSETVPVGTRSNTMVRAGVEMHWHELQCMQVHGDYYRDTGVAEYYPVRPTGSAFAKDLSEPWFDCDPGDVSKHGGDVSLTVERSTTHKTARAFSVFSTFGVSGLGISATTDTSDTGGVTLAVSGVRSGDERFWLCGTNDYAIYAKSAREVNKPW